jgi:hypothetical protein
MVPVGAGRATGAWKHDENTGERPMTTVLFLHGTGVREAEFETTYGLIEQGFKPYPGITMARCYWGAIGADVDRADFGKSFYFAPEPKKKKRGKDAAATEVPEAEKELARWARLFDDPLAEVRISPLIRPLPPGFLGQTLGERAGKLAGHAELAAGLSASGLTESFAEAVALLTGSPEFRDHFADSTAKDGETLLLLSRSLVAGCLAVAEDEGVVVTGAERERLVTLVRAAFDVPPDYAPEDYSWKTLTARAAGLWARKQRRSAVAQIADVVFYQARGSAIRRFVADRIREVAGPVVLLGHSLGGIIAFDLLAGPDGAGLGTVEMLVTVGSQASLLYELGALTSGVNYGSPLPGSFPRRWLNVYDQRDLLSYAGRKLFPSHCQDLEFDTGMPFPMAHGAYFDPKGGLYAKLAGAFPEARP